MSSLANKNAFIAALLLNYSRYLSNKQTYFMILKTSVTSSTSQHFPHVTWGKGSLMTLIIQ